MATEAQCVGPGAGHEGATKDSVSRVLLGMPRLVRWTNMAVLGEGLTPGTLVVLVCHGLVSAAHGTYLLLRSQPDRFFNDAGALIAAQVTWSYMLSAVLQRRTLRRLHQQLLHYCIDVESNSPAECLSLLKPLPRELRRLWVQQTVLTLLTWMFYTASPFIFEWIHGIPPGSLRRLSAMVWPQPCDLRGTACYSLTYFTVAFEWFWAAVAFSSVECTNLLFYTIASRLFDVLGSCLGQVYLTGKDLIGCPQDAARADIALRRCVRQHQFLLRWSQEMTEVYSIPTFIRLGAMVLLIALAILKPLLSSDYVLDEMPFVGLYGTQTIFVICSFADELHKASSNVHGSMYLASWEQGGVSFRRSLHIMMTRSLRPVRTRAVWVDNLSLRTFLDVINRAYSSLQTIRAARKRGMEQST